MPQQRVLIVEDEPDIADLIKHAVERGGDLEAEVAGSGDTALRAVAERPPDLVVPDLNLPVLERVWGYDRTIETRSVDVHVGRLRVKQLTAGRQIETVFGLGYRFID